MAGWGPSEGRWDPLQAGHQGAVSGCATIRQSLTPLLDTISSLVLRLIESLVRLIDKFPR
jgi:hypothetical protein